MPYIVTTHPSDDARHLPEPDTFAEHDAQQAALITRHAVTTLDEARAKVAERTGFLVAVQAIRMAGGTVGPLPDGTVIEVKHVGWDDFVMEIPVPLHGKTHDEIIAAFNKE